MADDKHIKSSCLRVTPASCVEYAGAGGSRLGVSSGQSIDYVLSTVLKELEKLTHDTDVISKLTKVAQDLASMNSSGIITNAKLYNLAGGNVSVCAGQISDKNLTYGITNTTAGVQFTYDLMNVIDNLPEGFVSQGVQVLANANTNTMSSVFINSNKTMASLSITPDQFPVSFQFTLTIGTPCGTIQLYRYLSVTGANQVGQWNTVMELKDLSSTSTSQLSQTDYNELLASKLAVLESRIENINTLTINEGSTIKYPDKGVNSVLQTHALEIETVKQQASKELKVTVDSTTGSVQQGVTAIESKLADLQSQLDIVKSKNLSLVTEVVKLGGSIS